MIINIQEHYNKLVCNPDKYKHDFLKNVRYQLPHLVSNITPLNETLRILKHKNLIKECECQSIEKEQISLVNETHGDIPGVLVYPMSEEDRLKIEYLLGNIIFVGEWDEEGYFFFSQELNETPDLKNRLEALLDDNDIIYDILDQTIEDIQENSGAEDEPRSTMDWRIILGKLDEKKKVYKRIYTYLINMIERDIDKNGNLSQKGEETLINILKKYGLWDQFELYTKIYLNEIKDNNIDEKIDRINPYEYYKGLKYEFELDENIDLRKLKIKVIKNLDKDPLYYTHITKGIKKSNKKRTDIPQVVKKDNFVDKDNGMKPAKLNESTLNIIKFILK